MITKKAPLYGETTTETLSTNAVSGAVQLVRCGKVRQLTFNDAKAPAAGYITIPQLAARDRPIYITQTVLLRENGGGTLIWLRTDGTFGWSFTTASSKYNGTMTWVVA